MKLISEGYSGDKPSTLYKRADGTVGIIGIDLSTLQSRIIDESNNYIVVYVPGRSYFGGIGIRNYASPELMMMKKKGAWQKNHHYGETIEVQRLFNLDMPKGWLSQHKRKEPQ